MLKGVAQELNEHLGWKLVVPRKAMLACYPGNQGRYIPHRDNTVNADGKSTNRREITCCLYANPEWRMEDGGTFRAHPDVPYDSKETQSCGYIGKCDGLHVVLNSSGLMTVGKFSLDPGKLCKL